MEQHREQGAGGKWVREEGRGIYIQRGRGGGRAWGAWHISHIETWNSLVRRQLIRAYLFLSNYLLKNFTLDLLTTYGTI